MSHYAATVVVKAGEQAEVLEAVEVAMEPFDENLEVEPYTLTVSEQEVARAVAWANRGREERGEPLLGFEDEAGVLAAVSTWAGREVERSASGALVYESTYNWEGHWDYWTVGGRWSGAFLLTDGSRADVARAGQVDLAGMRAEAAAAAAELFDGFEEATAGLQVPPSWREVRARYAENEIEQARQEYHGYAWVQAARKGLLLEDPHEAWCMGADNPREAFIARQVAGVGVPYAWLQEGCWERQGYIGMFMCMAEEDPAQVDEWHRRVASKWENLDPEVWVVNVDCHT